MSKIAPPPKSTTAHKAAFKKFFDKLCIKQSPWQAWSDFVEITACEISMTCDFRKDVSLERKARYEAITSRYSKDEFEALAQMLAALVNALEEEPEQDFLGDMFMALELGNHWKGL